MDTMPHTDPMQSPRQNPLGGLDPADLLKQGAADDSMVDGAPAVFVPPTLEELATIFPQFEILELIGRGGMGAVYKVRQKDLDRIVALKILPSEIGQAPEFSNRFTREAKALAKLNHPGIVTIHEFGQTDGLYYILMEFVDGVNLAQLMKTARVSPREALAIVPQICDALQFAHDQGIVHRDIKPENILLDRHGRVKVADFGIAKVVAAVCDPTGSGDIPAPENQTLAGKIIGTPAYMAPEQIEHPSDVDHRADIYALGVVFYQMLTGELPGKHLTAPSKKVHIDVRLDEIVLQAMERNPELRFQQASVMKTRIDGLGGAALVDHKAESQSAIETVKDDLRMPAVGLGIVGAIFLGLAGAGILMGVLSSTIWQGKQEFGLVGWIQLVQAIVPLFVGCVLCLSSRSMRRLRGYGISVAGCIVSLFTVIGIPFGIWGLIILTKREVREAFVVVNPGAPPAKTRSTGTMIAIGCGVILLLGAILVVIASISLFWFIRPSSGQGAARQVRDAIHREDEMRSSSPDGKSAARVTGTLVLPKEFSETQQAVVAKAALDLLETCGFSEGSSESDMFQAKNGVAHIQITFPVAMGGNHPDEMLITFPLTSGSVWTRRGDKYERHAKFTPSAAAALSTALGHAPSAAFDAAIPSGASSKPSRIFELERGGPSGGVDLDTGNFVHHLAQGGIHAQAGALRWREEHGIDLVLDHNSHAPGVLVTGTDVKEVAAEWWNNPPEASVVEAVLPPLEKKPLFDESMSFLAATGPSSGTKTRVYRTLAGSVGILRLGPTHSAGGVRAAWRMIVDRHSSAGKVDHPYEELPPQLRRLAWQDQVQSCTGEAWLPRLGAGEETNRPATHEAGLFEPDDVTVINLKSGTATRMPEQTVEQAELPEWTLAYYRADDIDTFTGKVHESRHFFLTRAKSFKWTIMPDDFQPGQEIAESTAANSEPFTNGLLSMLLGESSLGKWHAYEISMPGGASARGLIRIQVPTGPSKAYSVEWTMIEDPQSRSPDEDARGRSTFPPAEMDSRNDAGVQSMVEWDNVIQTEEEMLKEFIDVFPFQKLPASNRLHIRMVAPDDPQAVDTVQIREDGTRSVLRLSNNVVVCDQHVKDAGIQKSSDGYGVLVTLNEMGEKRLATATKDADGNIQLAVIVDGEVKAVPVVTSQLGHQFVVEGFRDHEICLEIVRDLVEWPNDQDTSAMTGWLEKIDQGKADEAWIMASDYLRQNLSSEKFVEMTAKARQPLGRVMTRQLSFAKRIESPPGAPDGLYLVSEFDSSFANKQEAKELVTLHKEKDGAWKAAGYFIR